MPQAPLSRETAQAALDAVAQYGNKSAAARALGIPVPTFYNHFSAAVRYGLTGEMPVTVPEGMEIKTMGATTDRDGNVTGRSVRIGAQTGGEHVLQDGWRHTASTVQIGPTGVEREWVRTKEGERDPADVARILREAFDKATPRAEAIPAPSGVDKDLLAFVPLSDLHLGLLSWSGETGVSWDTNKAVLAISKAAHRLINSMPAADVAVVCGLGDALHASSDDNRTRSGHSLDTDTRYASVLKAACDLFVSVVDMALERHGKVVVRNLPGNHDETPAVAIAYYLSAWFRNEPRVQVDTDASVFWFHRHGDTMLAATHGHAAKPAAMPGVMAANQPKMWGATKFRYAFQGHIHHKTVTTNEAGGATVETLASPAHKDQWHHAQGYLSGRAMIGVTYSKRHGEIMRNTVAMT